MPSQILRKLTIRTCGFGTAEVKAALEGVKSANLIKMVGVTTAAKPGQTDKGEYLKLIGQFHAVNMITGETFDAAACILPSFISDSLAAALDQSTEVEFAIMIGANADPSAVTGYAYTVTPLIESKPSDKMAALMAVADAYVPPALGYEAEDGDDEGEVVTAPAKTKPAASRKR